MRQAVHVLAVLVIGSFFMAIPVAVAAPAAAAAPVVHAQSASSTDGQSAAESSLPESKEFPQDLLGQDQRYAIGAAGAALIMLVLLVRKLRGKTYFGLNWRKRG